VASAISRARLGNCGVPCSRKTRCHVAWEKAPTRKWTRGRNATLVESVSGGNAERRHHCVSAVHVFAESHLSEPALCMDE
jgi:hypothetical protein